MKTCGSERDKLCDLEDAINNGDLSLLLQVMAENVDLNAVLPSSVRYILITKFNFLTLFLCRIAVKPHYIVL